MMLLWLAILIQLAADLFAVWIINRLRRERDVYRHRYEQLDARLQFWIREQTANRPGPRLGYSKRRNGEARPS